MKCALIVAVAKNGAIGKDNDLLWHIPEDMRHFKETTSGHIVITGRKNYDSIPERFRPLPNRTTIVLTRQDPGLYPPHPNLKLAKTLDDAFAQAKAIKTPEQKVFIIGGGELYRQVLEADLVDELWYTEVFEAFEADVFFPNLDFTKWTLQEERHIPSSKSRQYAFSIRYFTKKS
ncbi:MAG: dihydrofolate reductase [Flavobacteriales bacterium]